MGSTLGACGDINRNVMASPAPYAKNFKPEYFIAQDLAKDLGDLLAPQSGAYYDVWLDGEQVLTVEKPEVVAARNDNRFGTNFEGSPEPIYGTQFLPRKFKIGITVPGDNSIDVLTNDVAIVVMTGDDGEVCGYNVLVGGGMGRSHNNQSTFPTLAEPLGYVDKDDIYHVVKAIVATQRDYGRRDDRRMSRLKYLVHSWGIDKFRRVTEQYFGKPVEAFKPLPKWEHKNYFGWGEQGDGKLFYGVFVMNGRLKGEGKKMLRHLIEKYELSVMLTAEQNLILCEIDPAWKEEIQQQLESVGYVDYSKADLLDVKSMACPALPLCGLAVTEAERGLPAVNKRVRALLTKVGLSQQESFVIRMTGCPNGCARPYMAELGFVGDGPNTYEVWLGGCPDLTRLAEPYQQKVKLREFEETLEPLFAFFKSRRKAGESFGDFCSRIGFTALREYQKAYVSPPSYAAQPRLAVDSATFDSLRAIAEKEGLTIAEAVAKVTSSYSA